MVCLNDKELKFIKGVIHSINSLYYELFCQTTTSYIVLIIIPCQMMASIATPLTMHMFAWTKARATLYVGLMLGVCGIVSIGVFVLIKILSKR